MNPAAHPELHQKAECAALDAYLAATSTTPARRMKLMDRAAAKVFRAAGAAPDVTGLFSTAVTALVLERVQREKKI